MGQLPKTNSEIEDLGCFRMVLSSLIELNQLSFKAGNVLPGSKCKINDELKLEEILIPYFCLKISLIYIFFLIFLVLIDVSESPTDEKTPIDIYAIGFEEMVDLDAKNIMNTR